MVESKPTIPTTRQQMKERQIITKFGDPKPLRDIGHLWGIQKRATEMIKGCKMGPLRIG